MSQDGQAKINQINDTLGRYTTVLAQCIDSKTKNHALTKEKLETIATLIKKIEEKINTTQNNVKVLDESRKEWEVNLRKQTETENVKLKEQIEEERKKENELKEQMRIDGEKNSQLMDAANIKRQQLKAKLDELTKGKEEDNEKHRKELEDINAEKLKADEQHQKDIQTANAEREQAKENIRKNEEILKNELADAKQERAKKDQEYQAQLAKLGEDKDAAANLLKERINELNQEIEKMSNEKAAELEKQTAEKDKLAGEYGQKEETHLAEKKTLQDELKAAKKSHLEEVQRLKAEHTEEMEGIRKSHEEVSATQKEAQTKKNAETDELNKALKSCETTKKGYEEVMNNNQAKMEELMKKYKDNENIVLDEIIALLKSVGDIEVKQLQSLTSSGSSPGLLKRSGSLTDSLGEEGKQMMKKLRREQRKQAWGESSQVADTSLHVFNAEHIKNEYLPKSQLGKLKEKSVIREDPLYLWLKNLIGFTNIGLHKDLLHNILGSLQKGINNVDKNIGDYVNNLLQAVIVKDKHHEHHLFTNKPQEQIHKIYGGLIAASFTMHDPKVISQRLLRPSSEANSNTPKVFLEEAHFIIKHYLQVSDREHGENAFTNQVWLTKLKRSVGENFVNSPSFQAHHHSFDNRESLKGGFRHGKGSQKKNKRTLKSKLTAKKYSLKVGKKKRGKKGNKSQKRRKSIKIRI